MTPATAEHLILGAILDRWQTHDNFPQLHDHHFTLGLAREIWRHSRVVSTADLGAHLESLGRPNAQLVIDQLLLMPCLPPLMLQTLANRIADRHTRADLIFAAEAVAKLLRSGELSTEQAKAKLLEVAA